MPLQDLWLRVILLKIELPYEPVIPLQGVYTKEMKLVLQRDIWTPIFILELVTVVKIWKWPKRLLMDEWIKKMWYLKYYSIIKNKELLPFVTIWKNLKDIMPSEISQPQKQSTAWSHLYVKSKKVE